MGFEDLILKTSCIAFHVHYNCIFMHLVVCYTCWTVYVLVGLDWVEPMMLFTLHITCSCFLHSIYLCIFELFGTFLSVSFFPPPPSLSLVNISVSMAPKRKSTSYQNPLRSKASTSSDPTPFSIRFRDENARNDFLEKFSRWGVHVRINALKSYCIMLCMKLCMTLRMTWCMT